MAVTALKNEIDNNPLLSKLNKLPVGHGSAKPPFTLVKKIFVITTDQESVNNSKKFLDLLTEGIKHLPKDDLQGMSKANAYVKMLNGQQANLNKFIYFTSQYEIDDTNTKKLIFNIKKCLILIGDMLDYMNFAITTQLLVEELKSSPKLSAEELKAKIAA